MTEEAIRLDSMAHGGEAVGRAEGKAVFVSGGVPGDLVTVDVVADKKRFTRGDVDRVVDASPDRIQPPCPVFARCGGCDWQMMDLGAQRRWKTEVVRSQIAHVGGLTDVPVAATVAVGGGFRYRNRIDLRVSGGRPALFAARTHQPVEIDDCPLVIEPIAERIRRLRPASDVERVTIRGSGVTGEVVELRHRSGRWERGRITEVVAGRRFRISGRGFFQVNTPGAEALVRIVGEHLRMRGSDTLLDGYAGGGLFSATVGAGAGAVISVENDRQALSDLSVNAPAAEVVAGRFERAVLPIVDAAVVDPPRSGLGEAGVAALVAARPSRLAYVSCDAAALARDLGLLTREGFEISRVVPVDMFPNTHHIEAVACLVA